ncbi:hypothetical protein MOV66_06565 [Agrobacterium sp. SHOUNA12C]|nr:hypothetical protein [Agrobacterium sp. BETTINA12B]MCJ9756301.1 hypothetical protein [Agrobacterium sp. SHOUNA12C]
MPDGPRLPDYVTPEKVEQYLVRIAQSIMVVDDPEPYWIWWDFLEKELVRAREREARMGRVREALSRAGLPVPEHARWEKRPSKKRSDHV